MSTHSITAEIEYRFRFPGLPYDENETAYPVIEIEFDYRKGCPERGPTYASGGEPADPAEVELIGAKLINSDGVTLTPEQIEEMAADWLNGVGYDRALDAVDDGDDR